MESVQLHDIGTKVFRAFEELLTPDISNKFTWHRHLTDEEQRFRLWAHSLGLNQKGHASLDYRVRDALIVKNRLAQVLSKLQEHLENILAVANGARRPFEQDADIDDDSDDQDPTESDNESHASERSHSGSQESFHEVDFRLHSLTESLDSLYGLATRIRNPRNRPQRPNDQLYKHIPTEIRASYINEREEAETAIIAYAQRQQLIEIMPREGRSLAPSSEELVNQYATTVHWLICRTGIANARRRQQFTYWKGHALRLSQDSDQNTPTALATGQPSRQPYENQPIHAAETATAAAPSLATSATELSLDPMRPGDVKSVISHQSRLSTVMDLKGEKLEWPAPPFQTISGPYFTCPYCKILCPQRYRTKDAWRVHVIHDLQPYHCTYKDCRDPYRLYGTRQDWIDHESQHSRVWHCQTHGEEFETQPEYVEHLKTSHPEATPEHFSPELISSVVGPSLKPHRDCPFCPTAFSEVTEMERHITFHLERCALLALPLAGDGSDGGDSPGRPSDSHEVQHQGRQGSIALDFDVDEEESFLAFCFRQSSRASEPQSQNSESVRSDSDLAGDSPDAVLSRAGYSRKAPPKITETNLKHLDTDPGIYRLKAWIQGLYDAVGLIRHEMVLEQAYNDPWKLAKHLCCLFGQENYKVEAEANRYVIQIPRPLSEDEIAELEKIIHVDAEI
ncbi:hypothetical protein F5Y06DRAFT_156068 [Hypoxylon sp. FL0890]|nr:hypothetical protein F5Y06DRAFT_156068 [Hypoxylon sp. FL0890]